MAKIVYLFAFVACVQVGGSGTVLISKDQTPDGECGNWYKYYSFNCAIATALNCYSCDIATCQADESKWQKIEKCGNNINQDKHVAACLLQMYTDKTTQKEVSLRKCVIGDKPASGAQPIYNCLDKDGPTKLCHVCTSDYCNRSSASTVSFSFVTLLGVMAAYLIPKYL